MSYANRLSPATTAAVLVPSSAAGSLPRAANAEAGKKSPPLVETPRAAAEENDNAQAPASPLVNAAGPSRAPETGAAQSPRVIYRGPIDCPSVPHEQAEQQMLIAEGVAILQAEVRTRRCGGRPTVIDAELKSKIATLVGTGLSLRQAAAFLGVTHPTVSKAIQEDPALKEEIELARSRATLHPLACILREAGTNWKAAVWLLDHLRKVAYDEKTPLEKAEQGVESSVVSTLLYELREPRTAEAKAALRREAARGPRR